MGDGVITLFLADDHQLVVEGLTALVSQDPCIQIVGHCNNGLAVLNDVKIANPDVLVLDISLPGMNGLDLCRLVKQALPQVAVMMLTMHTNEQCVLEALENGALGYLVKESISLEFREAVHAVSRGEIYLGQSIPISVLERVNRRAPDPYSLLTNRQRQVLQLSAESKSQEQIAQTLGIPHKIAQEDYASLTKSLGIQNQTDLIKFAIRKHIITV
jgi:DNA-binding NarL/FixJ family response regulator